MGIDNEQRGISKKAMRTTTSTNNYQHLLVKLYAFLARRTDSKFNKVIYKRLNQSKSTRYPVSLSKLVKYAKTEEVRKNLLVVVAPVLNDERLLVVPKMRVCAIKFTDEARARIVKAGGECLTFDQLA